MGTIVLQGKVVSGRGEGVAFTQLTWVRAQFEEKLGIDPHPGTLNLRLDEPAELEKWRRLKAEAGITIEPASPDFCEARSFPAVVTKGTQRPGQSGYGQPAAVILPDVPGYPQEQIELIASTNLRETLGLGNGDVVTVCLEGGEEW